jgi:hypothetical protein
MMIPRLRIAILECDEPVGKTKEKYGTYGGLFTELLQNGAIRFAGADHGKKPELEISSWDIVNKDVYPRLEDVDAVLLTGSSTYTLFANTYTRSRPGAVWLWRDVETGLTRRLE